MTTSASVSGLAGGGGVLGPARMSIHGADDVVAELMRGYVAEQAAQSWVAHSHARVADIEPVDMNKLHLHRRCGRSSLSRTYRSVGAEGAGGVRRPSSAVFRIGAM
jgi:hypothetical protein